MGKIKIVLILAAVLLVVGAVFIGGVGKKEISSNGMAAVVSASKTEMPVPPQFIGLHWAADSFTTTILSISADGTYSKIYPQGDSYLELFGKWTYNNNKGVYDFVPNVEDKKLGFVREQMLRTLTNVNNHEGWYKVSDDPKFPGYSPIGRWTAATDSGTAQLEIGGDSSFYYIRDGRSSTVLRERWLKEGNYLYDVDNWNRRSGIWDPLKAVPMIRIDTENKKILFIDEDGDEIVMKRAQ
jgi:hypothetical protein